MYNVYTTAYFFVESDWLYVCVCVYLVRFLALTSMMFSNFFYSFSRLLLSYMKMLLLGSHLEILFLFDMLWSLAYNIAERLLFERNNIASTVNKKPNSSHFIPSLYFPIQFSSLILIPSTQYTFFRFLYLYIIRLPIFMVWKR